MAEARVEEQAQREAALRREWAGKTKAAEWALKAHRDKQVRVRIVQRSENELGGGEAFLKSGAARPLQAWQQAACAVNDCGNGAFRGP